MFSETNTSLHNNTSNTKEEQIVTGRMTDLANTCYNRNIPVFSSFLNLSEQNYLSTCEKSISPVYIKTDGGYGEAERKIAVFLPAKEWDYQLPVNIIKIDNITGKFKTDLTHRDYLGALMNLGIERSLLGDIIISEGCAYVFCLNKITDFILDNLFKIKNNLVSCSLCESLPDDFKINYLEICNTVASVRLDSLISLAFNESRSKSVSRIESATVFVNGRLITTNAYNPKPGEIISVRGLGRFKYINIKNETKKGRLFVILHKYV